MAYEERNTIAHLISTMLVVGAFFFYLFRMAPLESATEAEALMALGRAFLAMVVAGVVLSIVSTIVINIVAGIAMGIATGESPEFLSDERDKLLELRAIRVSMGFMGAGTVGGMAGLAFGQSPFDVFLIIILAGAVADVIGSAYKLVVYRRGY